MTNSLFGKFDEKWFNEVFFFSLFIKLSETFIKIRTYYQANYFRFCLIQVNSYNITFVREIN